jgi:hypothetical protein
MIVKYRWYLAATIGVPLVAFTGYLLWLWPKPSGSSFLAQVGPYLVSLLTGLPFAWLVTRGPSRAWLLVAFFVVGFIVLWIYALAVLCGVRGVCL